MRVAVPSFFTVVILLLLLLAGCAPVTPTSRNGIGVVRVSGPNVWINNTPARNGETIQLGNTLTTGSGSSALVEFFDGGELQLDENTDPLFEWLEQSKCILIRIIKGQAYLRKERACIEGPNLSLVLDSEVNLAFQQPPGQSVVTLLRGSAEVTAPVRTKLVPGQQLELSFDRTVPTVRTLPRAELQDITRWRKAYRFPPLPARQPEFPPIVFPPREPRTPPPPKEEPKPEPAPPTPTPTPPTEPKGPPPELRPVPRLPGELIRKPAEPVIR